MYRPLPTFALLTLLLPSCMFALGDDVGDDDGGNDCPYEDVECASVRMGAYGVDLVGVGGERTIRVTAVGGTQRLRLTLGWGSELPFNRPYAAAFPGQSVMLLDQGPDWVSIRATSAGIDVASFTEPGTGLVYSMIGFPTATLDRVETMWLGGDEHTYGRVGYYLGTPLRLGLRLMNSAGDWLVDDSLSLAAPTTWTVAHPTWDSFAIDDLPEGLNTADIVVAGRRIPLDLEVVTAVDAVALLTPLPGPVRPGDQELMCFRATRASAAGGELDSVVGLPWSITVSGPVSTRQTGFRNCIDLTATGTGAVTVTATAAGVEGTASFTVQ